MIRNIMVLTVLSTMPLVSQAKSQPQALSITQSFFKGLTVEPDSDLIDQPSTQKYAPLAAKIALKIQELGLNVTNLKDHGVTSQDEFRVRKAKSQFPVLHFDVANVTPRYFDRFTFDLVYAKGSEFFAEQDSATLQGCRGFQRRDGTVEIHLESCLKKHYAELQK